MFWKGDIEAPYHIQVALGKTVVYLEGPDDSDFQILGVAALARPAMPDVTIAGTAINQDHLEIFKSQTLSLSSPIAGALPLPRRREPQGRTPERSPPARG